MSLPPTTRDAPQNQSHHFWGEMAPSEHFVQIYQDDSVFLDTVEGFVAGGLSSGDGVIVIATAAHLSAIEDRLTMCGIDLAIPLATDQYIPLNADEAMAQFMVRGWPDEILFESLVTRLMERARGEGRRVRAFGEMVALMWAQGLNGATVRLEHLWHRLCHKEAFSLFCAYPRSGFTLNADDSIREICATHSKVIGGENPN